MRAWDKGRRSGRLFETAEYQQAATGAAPVRRGGAAKGGGHRAFVGGPLAASAHRRGRRLFLSRLLVPGTCCAGHRLRELAALSASAGRREWQPDDCCNSRYPADPGLPGGAHYLRRQIRDQRSARMGELGRRDQPPWRADTALDFQPAHRGRMAEPAVDRAARTSRRHRRTGATRQRRQYPLDLPDRAGGRRQCLFAAAHHPVHADRPVLRLSRRREFRRTGRPAGRTDPADALGTNCAWCRRRSRRR